MGVPGSAVSRVTGVDVAYKNFNTGAAQSLPQRLAILGQGNSDVVYDLTTYECDGSAASVAARYGYGSPLHIAALKLFPTAGVSATFPVTIYPLKEAANATAATGTITVTGKATENTSGKIYIADTLAEFAVSKDDTAVTVMGAIKDAINGVLEMPVTAAIITPEGESATPYIQLTSKWKGASANLITIDLDAENLDIGGLTFSKTDMTGGALDPKIDDALDRIGDVWETFLMDTLDWKNTDRLDTYQSFGDDRWGWLNKKGCVVAHGCTDDYTTRTAVTDQRKNDKINFLITSVKSRALPFAICAKGLVSDIMTTADSNPAQGYKGQLTGIHAASAAEQENYTVRNASVMKGASTNIKTGSVAELNDIITFYHPESYGKFPPYRKVVNMVKLQNVVYNVRLVMEAEEFKEAPLVEDSTVTDNPTAVQPKTVKAALYTLADSLAKKAIIQQPDFTKKNMTVGIDSENPDRINVKFPVKLSGNVTVSSSEIFFGFYLGE